MEKYLFTDGTNGIIEVQSQEELSQLIASAPKPELVRIWVFNSSEWLTHAGYSKINPVSSKKEKPIVVHGDLIKTQPTGRFRWFKKALLAVTAGAAIFFIYNFTKIKWEHAGLMTVVASRPANVPAVDADSVAQTIEAIRGSKLDKATRTNLRIRNDWPEQINLQMITDRDTNHTLSHYYNMEFTIDNSTGYMIDNAVVKITVWKNNSVSSTDTLQFNNISYAMAARRKWNESYKGDSIAISFQSIRAKAFNFCYSSDKKSNYGNINDKWFCR